MISFFTVEQIFIIYNTKFPYPPSIDGYLMWLNSADNVHRAAINMDAQVLYLFVQICLFLVT